MDSRVHNHPGNTPQIILKRRALPPRQAQTLDLIERYHAATGEACPVTYVSRELGVHHETVRESVSVLFERGLVLGPGSPVTPAEPLARPMGRYHYVVYFLLDTKRQLVKIGRTIDLQMRLAQIRKSRGGLLLLIGCVDGLDQMRELDWHKRFRDGRMFGEWFALTEELTAEISSRFGVKLTTP